MKVWFKLLLGSILGIILGSFLPQDNQTVIEALAWLEGLAIRIGRYAIVPILVFSLTIAIYELRQDGQFWPLALQSFLAIIACAAFVITSGILVTLIFTPARVLIQIEEEVETIFLNTADNILGVFPANMFSAVVNEGIYLLPVCVFSFFLGMGLSYDRNYSKPVIAMLDSLSRVFYHIASFFSEILGLVMIALAAFWAVRFHNALKAGVYLDLIVLLGVFSIVMGFGILPLVLYFIKPKCGNPWAVLYGSLGQALAAFFSGDINFTLPVLFRHLKENSGCRRRSNAVTVTLFTSFGRAGSAMVAAAAFIVIIKSYSSLDIRPLDILAIGGKAFLISFLLARHPGDGAYAALAVLCLGYGRIYESGYLNLKSIAFYLIAIGTFLDVMIATFASYALARINNFQEDKKIRHFI
jgi:Na+/H+-dicarboxylate symporter